MFGSSSKIRTHIGLLHTGNSFDRYPNPTTNVLIECGGVKVFRNEGIRGLYRGTVARMGRVVPGQGIIFMCFEKIENFVLRYLA